MPEQPSERERRLANELALYRYSRALERGDIETIAAILQEACSNAELERMIYALHTSDQSTEQAPIFTLSDTQNPSMRTAPDAEWVSSGSRREPRRHRPFQMLAAILAVGALVIASVLLFSSRHVSSGTANPSISSSPTRTTAAAQGLIIMLLDNGDVQAYRGGTGERVWSYSTEQHDPGANGYRNALIVQNHTVYVAVHKSIYALSESTGKFIWQHKLPVQSISIQPPESQLLVDANIVYVSIETEPQSIAYALRASDGQALWQVSSTDVYPPLLTASGGIAYVAIQNTSLTQTVMQARRGSDGQVLWNYTSSGAISFATVANQVLYVYAFPGAVPPGGDKQNKQLLAFQMSSGTRLWSRNVAYGNYQDNIVYAQGVLIINDRNQLCAHSSTNGDQLWCINYSGPYLNSYIAGPDKLYTAYSSDQQNGTSIDALDLQHGQSQWTNSLVPSPIDLTVPLPLALVQPQQSTLLVPGNRTTLITAIDTSNGHILWQIHQPAKPATILQVVATS